MSAIKESQTIPYLFWHFSSLHGAVQQGNSAMGTLNVYCYVIPPTPPPPPQLLLPLLISSLSNINFIHIHTWSLYICSLAFECCNITLVLVLYVPLCVHLCVHLCVPPVCTPCVYPLCVPPVCTPCVHPLCVPTMYMFPCMYPLYTYVYPLA